MREREEDKPTPFFLITFLTEWERDDQRLLIAPIIAMAILFVTLGIIFVGPRQVNNVGTKSEDKGISSTTFEKTNQSPFERK